MKKIFTSTILSGFLTVSLFAQDFRKNFKEADLLPAQAEMLNHQPESSGINLSQFSVGDTLWKEDFGTTAAGSLPAGWVQSGTDQIWKKTTKNSPGCLWGTSNKLHSTSEANGTFIFDGDSANKAQVGGTCPSPAGTGYTQKTGSVTTGPINLTGNANVILKFQHRFRLCCSVAAVKLGVEVSGDGGATWTALPDARGSISLNQTPISNPDIYTANISTAAGNQSDVRIRFTFDSNLGVYFWELDDIVIVQALSNELILTKAITDFYYAGGGYYTQIPLKQVAPLPSFNGIVKNDGVNAQSNAMLNVDIKRGSTGVYNQNSPGMSLAPATVDTFIVNNPYTPNVKGEYTTTYTVGATAPDDNMSNNTIIKTFEIVDSVYARDQGNITGSTISPSNYVGGNTDGSAIGTVYEMNDNDVASSVSFYLEDNTAINASMQADIFRLTIKGDVIPTPVVSSGLYDVIDSTYMGKWVMLPLVPNGGENLSKDSTYIAAITSLGESLATVRISSDLITQQPGGTSLVKTNTGWGGITVLPRIRLNMKTTVGVNELSKTGSFLLGQNIPNPFDRSTRIGYELSRSGNVKLEVYDVTGKRVMEHVEGQVSAGRHQFLFDQDLKPGVYFYSLIVDGEKATRRMIITK